MLRIVILCFVCLFPVTTFAEDGNGPQEKKTALFAGGCFWCIEEAFEKKPGVIDAISGFSGGDIKNPSYKQVAAGQTDHIETVKVIYDPEQISYANLLVIFWQNIDPYDQKGQFCDKGNQYKAFIFYKTRQQEQLARKSRDILKNEGALSGPVATEIREFKNFYKADASHQGYYKKNPLRYNFYKSACGRSARLEEIWGNKNLSRILIPRLETIRE